MTNTYNDALEKAALIAESEDYHHDGEIWIVTQIAKKIRALKRPEPDTSEVPTKHKRGDRIIRDGRVLEFIEEELEGEKWLVVGPAAPDGDPRDALIKELMGVLEALVDAMHQYGMDVDDEPPQRHSEMMRRASAALSKAKGVVDG